MEFIMSRIDLSIVVTAHSEGILLHKTLRSVFRSIEKLKKNRIKFEVIVHVDNGNEETLECLRKYANKEKIIIVENSFGSLSQSRNFAVSVAKGKYVSFLDGDDLISENWYLNALTILRENDEECIVYPESVLTFQDDNSHVLTIQRKFDNSSEDYLTILSANLWGSVVMAKRETFLKVPYIVMSDGYCYEDYAFNVQTLERNIPHLIAPKTVLFYRRSNNSMLAQANNNSLVLPRMNYFDFERIKKKFPDNNVLKEENFDDEARNDVITHKKKTFRDYTVYKIVRSNWFLNYLITPFLRLALEARRVIIKSEDEKINNDKRRMEERLIIPYYVLEEWRKINEIEIQLYPRQEDIDKTILYDARESINIGKAFVNLSHSFSHMPDYVFVVPWLTMGGADKVLLNYVDALLEINPTWHIAVISTLPADNKWVDKLPGRVDFYDFGRMTKFLSEGGANVLFSLLLTQLDCSRLHIINSEFGYRWVRDHNLLVKKHYTVNVSFFAEERVDDGNGEKYIVSFENPCLFNIFDNVKNVFTDNKNIVNIIVDRNAFAEEKFKVHYQPIKVRIKGGRKKHKKTKRILWAGRIDIVKMPELVLEIGRRLKDDIQIDIYGTIANDCYDEQMLNKIDNVRYCGEYNGFSELPVDNYDLFLYTSRNDGVPNTILEATAAGLPIIASNDGGVGEFIVNKKTGILIKDFEKPDEYVKVIKDVYYGNKYDLEKMVESAQKSLIERHSWKAFIKTIRDDLAD